MKSRAFDAFVASHVRAGSARLSVPGRIARRRDGRRSGCSDARAVGPGRQPIRLLVPLRRGSGLVLLRGQCVDPMPRRSCQTQRVRMLPFLAILALWLIACGGTGVNQPLGGRNVTVAIVDCIEPQRGWIASEVQMLGWHVSETGEVDVRCTDTG